VAAISGIGITLSPLIGNVFMFHPEIFPVALGMSTAIFTGSSAYAYMKPSGSLLYLKGPLYGALFGIIGL